MNLSHRFASGKILLFHVSNSSSFFQEPGSESPDVGAVGGEDRPATPSPDYEDAIEGKLLSDCFLHNFRL